MMNKKINRRNFIKTSVSATAGLAVTKRSNSRSFRQDEKVRIGIIGVGSRGRSLQRSLLVREDVEVPAVCDIIEDRTARAQKMVEDSGRKKAEGYSRGEEDFRRMVIRDDLDGVIVTAPRQWHARMSVAAMKAGKHVGTEVPAALTLDECWDIVNAHESTGKFCMLLENYCYFRHCMAVLNMVRQGLFGILTHCECGYQHDTRYVVFGPEGELQWRGEIYTARNGILYPTHGIGPMAECLNINRGNRFLYLVSMSTPSYGMNNYIIKKFGPDHPNAIKKHALADVASALIKCQNGETVTMNYDTISPRPASFMYRVQGTKGIWMVDNNSIYLEDRSPKPGRWEPFDKYQEEFDHPVWKEYGQTARKTGHGGSDYFVVRDFVECVKRRISPPIDVYDAATWSSIVHLSEQSIEQGSAPVEFPDFTRGKWINNKPIFGLRSY